MTTSFAYPAERKQTFKTKKRSAVPVILILQNTTEKMKITISSVLSALAAVAVVSGFIVPNHGVVNHHHHLLSNTEQASRATTTTTSATATFLSKFRSNSRLLMSETRTFERREGRGGRGSDSSYQGRGGGRGRGGE